MALNGSWYTSETDEWGTPAELYAELNAAFGPFTLDVCASAVNAKCPRFFTRAQNGLAQSWAGEMVWMNPPYGDPEFPCKPKCKKKRCAKRGWCAPCYIPGISDWMRKACIQVSAANPARGLVALIPSRTDTEWWHRYVQPLAAGTWPGEVRLLEGRQHFVGAKSGGAPFPSAVAVYRNTHELIRRWTEPTNRFQGPTLSPPKERSR